MRFWTDSSVTHLCWRDVNVALRVRVQCDDSTTMWWKYDNVTPLCDDVTLKRDDVTPLCDDLTRMCDDLISMCDYVTPLCDDAAVWRGADATPKWRLDVNITTWRPCDGATHRWQLSSVETNGKYFGGKSKHTWTWAAFQTSAEYLRQKIKTFFDRLRT